MDEANFEVTLSSTGLFSVLPKNDLAVSFEKEFLKTFSDQTVLKFILLCPNTMDLQVDGSLLYEVDLSFKEEIFKQLKANYEN